MGKIKKWSAKEDVSLKQLFKKGLSIDQVASKLGRSKSSVQSRKRNFKIVTRHIAKWSNKELQILKKYSGKLTAVEIHKKYLTNKLLGDVYRKRLELKLKHKFMPIEWNDAEIALLKKNVSTNTDKELAKIIKSKNQNQIYSKRIKLGLKAPNSKKIYPKEKLEIIKNNLNLKDSQIAKIIGEDESYVFRARITKLGIKKKNIKTKFPKYFNDWFDPKLNNMKKLEEYDFSSSSKNKKVQIILVCPKNKYHKVTNSIKNIVTQYKSKGRIICRYCTFKIVAKEESFASNFPNLSSYIFDKEKDKPSNINLNSYRAYKFICSKGHVTGHTIRKLTLKSNGKLRKDYPFSCPICKTGLLKDLRPDLFKEIDRSQNKNIDLDKLLIGSNRVLKWVCNKNPNHKWSIAINKRAGKDKVICPFCIKNWNKKYLKMFLESLIEFLPSMNQSERWVFFQQSGILDSSKRNVAFAKQIISQKFPQNELEKFVNNEVSLVDDILDDPTLTSEDYLNKEEQDEKEIEKEISSRIQAIVKTFYRQMVIQME